MQQHLEHLEEVFSRFRKAKLKPNPAKCEFGVNEIAFIGHVLSGNGMAPQPSKIAAMKECPTPKHVRALKGLIGTFSFCKRYVKGFAIIINPLLELLRKDVPFIWDDECQQSFDRLKEAMCSAPILRLPVMGQKFYLLTDASSTAISYTLAQKNEDNVLTPCAYGGRAMRGPELSYGATQIEMLAILERIKNNHSFLANQCFEILCDHVSLQWIKSLNAQTGRLGRWGIYLQGYSFIVTHVPGRTHYLSDSLSRREYKEESKDDAETEFEDLLMRMGGSLDELEPPKVTPKRSTLIQFEYEQEGPSDVLAPMNGESTPQESQEITNDWSDIGPLQRVCPDSRDMIIFLEQGILPVDESKARKIALTSENYEMIDNKLFYISRPRNAKRAQLNPVSKLLLCPRSIRAEIVEAYHHQNGHIGLERLYASITTRYHWSGIWNDLLEVTKACVSCQTANLSSRPRFAPLYVIPAESLFQKWSMDILGPLKESTSGHKYILLFVESLSKWT